MAFSGKASGDQIKGRPRAAFFDAALVRNQDFYGRAAPAVAVAFRDAAGRGTEPQIHLRFENALAGVVIDRFGRGTPCVPDGPDKFICTVEVAVSPNFFGWLASFGARAELLSPASVREAFVALCREAEAANS